MQIIYTHQDLSDWVATQKKQGCTIGFVPTMGALHAGHISLLELANVQTDRSVCSIFVNPTQFTDPKDLERYPRPLEKDLALLRSHRCAAVFVPSVAEMYPVDEAKWHIDLGSLETILEGTFRPGHYQGVTQIVYKLFKAVQPDKAFFGQKDFQQTLVIKKMLEHFQLPIELQVCPTLRDEDGLAMSSRNIHLSPEERRRALVLSRTLAHIKELYPAYPLSELEVIGKALIQEQEGVDLEYFGIRYRDTLEPARDKDKATIALVAAKVGGTRLIDNEYLH